MKSINAAQPAPCEIQPQIQQKSGTRFIAIYDSDSNPQERRFSEQLIRASKFPSQIIDASKFDAKQIVGEICTKLPKDGHLLFSIHGNNKKLQGCRTHYMGLPNGEDSDIATTLLIQMVVDQLGIKPEKIDQPDSSLPFLYFFSCDAGALRKQIPPGSYLWKRAHIVIFAGTRSTSVLSSGNSISGAIAYVDYCHRSSRKVDPLKLLFFAGMHRGDCLTLMGGNLNAPLVWHAPKSGQGQNLIDNLRGSSEDKKNFEQAVALLSSAEYDLLPAASLEEVLYNRIIRGDARRLGELLAAHPELRETPMSFGTFPLMLAVAQQGGDCLQQLLNAGANPNRPDDNGNTALIEAVAYPDIRIEDIETLIAHGADINLPNLNGETPLMFACNSGHTDVVRMFLACGADANRQDNNGMTALMYAADVDDTGPLRQLLARKARGDLFDKDGHSALAHAALNNRQEALGLLLADGDGPSVGLIQNLIDEAHLLGRHEITRMLEIALKHFSETQ